MNQEALKQTCMPSYFVQRYDGEIVEIGPASDLVVTMNQVRFLLDDHEVAVLDRSLVLSVSRRPEALPLAG